MANRPKRSIGKPVGPWITARKIVQSFTLAIFIVLFIGSQSTDQPAHLMSFPMRLDPLLILSHLFASRVFLVSSALALITIILTLVFGRAWCGWICPLGTILDLFSFTRKRNHRSESIRQPSEAWRRVKYILLLTTLLAALFGNLTLLFLDPLTILYRTLTISLWPALDQAVTALEAGLYRIPSLANLVSAFDAWVRPGLLPSQPAYYRNAFLFGAIFFGIILLNLAAPRFWCRYLCPLGAFLGLISKLSLFRRDVSEECRGCDLCIQVCPTGTIDSQRNYASDPSECTMCMDCLEACPRSSITFHPKISIAQWQEYDPNRRQAITTFGLTVAALALLQSDAIIRRENNFLLRPPGARENNLLSKCVRCAECIRACPTNALQPATSEAGLEGLWTPVLVPRLGYCDFSCNACGDICPIEAIPPLSLEEKRLKVIGHAFIDQNRCIAWSDHTDCIVCEEMCPLPDKAIHLELSQFSKSDGTLATIQLPHVDRSLCIGCGICEYKCPVNGDAAIRVYVPQTNLIA